VSNSSQSSTVGFTFSQSDSFNSLAFGHSATDRHVFPDPSCTMPKLIRDEFVRLATILDFVLMDADSLHFKHGELAAAVLINAYEPESLVEEITGFSADDLAIARAFIEPYAYVSEQMNPAGSFIPTFSDVLPEDRHNIQLYPDNTMDLFREAQALRATMSFDCSSIHVPKSESKPSKVAPIFTRQQKQVRKTKQALVDKPQTTMKGCQRKRKLAERNSNIAY